MGPTSGSSKGANPAPNYMAAMNKIHLLMDTRNKVIKGDASFRDTGASGSSATTPKLSGKAKAAEQSRLAKLARARQEAAEDDFGVAEDNVGLGVSSGGGSKDGSAAAAAMSKENQALRDRVLGKRRAREEHSKSVKRRRGEDSSDEETGRSGFGRAKKHVVARDAEKEVEDVKDGVHSDENESPGHAHDSEETNRDITISGRTVGKDAGDHLELPHEDQAADTLDQANAVDLVEGPTADDAPANDDDNKEKEGKEQETAKARRKRKKREKERKKRQKTKAAAEENEAEDSDDE